MSAELADNLALRLENVSKIYHPSSIKLHRPPTSVLDRMLGRRSSGDVTGGDDGMDDMGGDDDDTGVEDLFGQPEFPDQEELPGLVWGLRDTTLEIGRGAVVAVVGPPKSGKTTLLNLLSGLEPPSAGQLLVRGKIWPTTKFVSAFMAAGFTIKQNAVVAGKVGDVPKHEMLEHLDELYELLGIRPASVMGPTGMRTRALSIAAGLLLEPDIILLDAPALPPEEEFQRAAIRLLRAARDRNATIFIEQPDAELATDLCTHALWLQQGRVRQLGPRDEVLPAYVAAATEMTAGVFPRVSWDAGHGLRSFSGIAALTGVSIANEDGDAVDGIGPRDTLVVRVAFEFALTPAFAKTAIALTRDDGLRVWLEQPKAEPVTAPGDFETFARVRAADLPPGRYTGHVEAVLARDGLERVIARTRVFSLGVRGTEEAPTTLVEDGWLLREAEWLARAPLPQSEA
jgi:ABC-type polysaccharide/polyol phosphate transport system ATPase subunit